MASLTPRALLEQDIAKALGVHTFPFRRPAESNRSASPYVMPSHPTTLSRRLCPNKPKPGRLHAHEGGRKPIELLVRSSALFPSGRPAPSTFPLSVRRSYSRAAPADRWSSTRARRPRLPASTECSPPPSKVRSRATGSRCPPRSRRYRAARAGARRCRSSQCRRRFRSREAPRRARCRADRGPSGERPSSSEALRAERRLRISLRTFSRSASASMIDLASLQPGLLQQEVVLAPGQGRDVLGGLLAPTSSCSRNSRSMSRNRASSACRRLDLVSQVGALPPRLLVVGDRLEQVVGGGAAVNGPRPVPYSSGVMAISGELFDAGIDQSRHDLVREGWR